MSISRQPVPGPMLGSSTCPRPLPSQLCRPARKARRVPHAGRGREGALRRQGAPAQKSGPELFPRPRAHQQDAGHARAHVADRGDGHGLGDRGAAARGEPDQAAPAALQRAAARRQELSLHPARHGARVPPDFVLPRATQRTKQVLRALSEQRRHPRNAAAAAEAVSRAPVRRHVLREPVAPVPAIPDRALPGTVCPPGLARGLCAGRRRHDPACSTVATPR